MAVLKNKWFKIKRKVWRRKLVEINNIKQIFSETQRVQEILKVWEVLRVVMDANMHGPDQPDSTDPALVTKLVEELKSQGIFDEIRNECLSEVDSKVTLKNPNFPLNFQGFLFLAGLSKP